MNCPIFFFMHRTYGILTRDIPIFFSMTPRRYTVTTLRGCHATFCLFLTPQIHMFLCQKCYSTPDLSKNFFFANPFSYSWVIFTYWFPYIFIYPLQVCHFLLTIFSPHFPPYTISTQYKNIQFLHPPNF